MTLGAASSSLLAGPIARPRLAPGSNYYPASGSAVATSATLGVGTWRGVPWIIDRTLTIDRIGAEVSAAGEAGSKFRIIVWRDNGLSAPGALALDAGQILGDSAAVQFISGFWVLRPGVYWIGGVVQDTVTTQPTMRTIGLGWTPPIPLNAGPGTPGAGGTAVGMAVTGVTGAAPATAANPSATGAAPRLYVRAV